MRHQIKLITVSGSTCAGCMSLHQEMHDIHKKFPEVELIDLSVDKMDEGTKAFLEEFRVDKIPTLLLMIDNKEIGRVSGYQPAEILNIWLEEKLRKYS